MPCIVQSVNQEDMLKVDTRRENSANPFFAYILTTIFPLA